MDLELASAHAGKALHRLHWSNADGLVVISKHRKAHALHLPSVAVSAEKQPHASENAMLSARVSLLPPTKIEWHRPMDSSKQLKTEMSYRRHGNQARKAFSDLELRSFR